jgi:type IV pilus assembly protein PilP
MKESCVKVWHPAAALLVVTGLIGCANPELQDLERFVAEKKAESPGRIEPIPEIKQIETFLYEYQGRRDPFMPMEQKVTQGVSLVENGIQPIPDRRKEELESFALDSMRMVGLLEQTGIAWGLVRTKEGTIHRVKSGNHMGQNHGRIMLISEEKIELTEIIQDGSGGYSERQASLALTE